MGVVWNRVAPVGPSVEERRCVLTKSILRVVADRRADRSAR